MMFDDNDRTTPGYVLNEMGSVHWISTQEQWEIVVHCGGGPLVFDNWRLFSVSGSKLCVERRKLALLLQCLHRHRRETALGEHHDGIVR